jgi:hypothetical protein
VTWVMERDSVESRRCFLIQKSHVRAYVKPEDEDTQ